MNWLNDAHLTFEDAAYNPEPVTAGPASRDTIVDPNNPANLRLGVLNVGGGPTFQDKGQKGWALQDDLTFFGWEGHTLKMGVKYKRRSEAHTSELQPLMRISSPVLFLKKKI